MPEVSGSTLTCSAADDCDHERAAPECPGMENTTWAGETEAAPEETEADGIEAEETSGAGAVLQIAGSTPDKAAEGSRGDGKRGVEPCGNSIRKEGMAASHVLKLYAQVHVVIGVMWIPIYIHIEREALQTYHLCVSELWMVIIMYRGMCDGGHLMHSFMMHSRRVAVRWLARR